MSSPKINKTELKNLVIALGARLSAANVSDTNSLKKDITDALSVQTDKGKPKFIRLNKGAEKVTLDCLKGQPDDVKKTVREAIEAYRKILASKPKQLLSAYLTFSVEQGKTDALKELRKRGTVLMKRRGLNISRPTRRERNTTPRKRTTKMQSRCLRLLRQRQR